MHPQLGGNAAHFPASAEQSWHPFTVRNIAAVSLHDRHVSAEPVHLALLSEHAAHPPEETCCPAPHRRHASPCHPTHPASAMLLRCKTKTQTLCAMSPFQRQGCLRITLSDAGFIFVQFGV